MLKLIFATAACAALSASVAHADIARGAYIARAADCASCHTNASNGKDLGAMYAGGRAMKTPLGTIFSTNITPDKTTGIGDYSLKDFDRAVRDGVAKDGHHLYPAMPYPSFARMSDADIKDLYDYFLHGVKPVKNDPPKTHLPFPFNMRWAIMFWNWLFKPHHRFQPDPKHDAVWNRGAYLVEGPGHCGACHTPRGLAYQERGTKASDRLFLTGGTQEYWHAPTLRGNVRTGLGSWTESGLMQFFRTGHAQGRAAYGAMSEVVEKSTQYLNDADRLAVARYLKSLTPGPQPFAAPPYHTQGQQEWPGAGLFTQDCAGCHGERGQGKDAPALAGNPAVMSQDPSSVVHMILKGGHTPQTGGEAKIMPGFETQLTDQEIARVATYVRQGWGNYAPSVSAGKVRAIRQKIHDEPMWVKPRRAQQAKTR